GEEAKIIRAATQIVDEEIATPILIGRPDVILKKAAELGMTCCAEIIDPANFPKIDAYARAVELFKGRYPGIRADGEMQADTAVVSEIADERYPFSAVKDANVLVFPSLESANIAYKLLARLGNAKAIGPILLGMGAPVHVLQTGDEVNDIVQVAAVAAMDAIQRK
ncbi:MAG: phosphate acyltransferase, partial [Anaerolineales bacterium]|nr:phosphate acyltransferase [Anaerolineales bacterium]